MLEGLEAIKGSQLIGKSLKARRLEGQFSIQAFKLPSLQAFKPAISERPIRIRKLNEVKFGPE